MKIQYRLPQCCGQDMRIVMESALFLELYCDKCNDVIYLKKKDIPKPQMLDD